MKKIWLLTTLLICGLLLTGCNKICTDDCWSEDLENHDQIQCGNVYDPICWEDWKVYSNWCYLNVAGAHWDETLWVKNDECFKITKESLYWKYILTRYNDNHNVRDNHNIELNISADWIFAKFCNHLGTSNYSLSWNILTVEEMSQTEMACEWENWEWLMNAESEFNLNDARVTLSEDNLTISTSRWAQYQFQISEDYNQFLEDIKNSWKQPQRINDYPEETGKENILVTTEEPMDVSHVINLKLWDKSFDVTLEDNTATKALLEKLKEWDIVVNAQDYWNFEKVWYLWFKLPTEDINITTQLWDLVLYDWNQISLFYNSNSWSYTKLWKVQKITESDFWDWDVTLVFSLLK
jgi:heat shock protein HslJ